MIQEQYFCALVGNLYYPTQFFLLIPNMGTIFTQAHVPIQKFNFFGCDFHWKIVQFRRRLKFYRCFYCIIGFCFLLFLAFSEVCTEKWLTPSNSASWNLSIGVDFMKIRIEAVEKRWICIQNAPRNDSAKLKFWKFNITRRSKKEQTVFCR